MNISRCFGCMNPIEEGKSVCPHCNFDAAAYIQSHQALPLGSILYGRYLIGRVLGQGGFGITYIGYDLVLETRVAIKEYYPSGQVIRAPGSTVLLWTNEQESDAGRSSFVREARKMEKMVGSQSVVRVRDVFFDNETAYIAMDYAEGITLKEHLERMGTITPEACFRLLAPIMAGLKQFHEVGLIHRDISPDNIMIEPSGGAILLDLGAAKDLSLNGNANSQLIAKHGFSPPEQYMENGRIGPWTDVYAMCATMVYCITGRVVPAAITRYEQDLLDLSGLPESLTAVLKKGLALDIRNRFESMEALQVSAAAALGRKNAQTKIGKNRMVPTVLGVICTVGALAMAFGKMKTSAVRTTTLETAINVQTSETALQETNAVAADVPVKYAYLRAAETFNELSAAGFDIDHIPLTPFWGQTAVSREQVERVQFHDSQDAVPDSAWDVSEDGTGSILAWMDGSVLHAAADGKIICRIPANLFYGFSNLQSIDWGGCVEITGADSLNQMFEGCASLIELDLSGFDTSSVTTMVDLFSGCTSLTSLSLMGWDTAHVTSMEWMFSDCVSLTRLDVTGLDTANVRYFGYMFSNCGELTELDVSGFNTANAEMFSFMFSGCTSLTELDVSGFDTAKATVMQGMFENCSSLTNLDVTGFDTSKVEDFRRMFSGCVNLEQLDVSGFYAALTAQKEKMFYHCTKLPAIPNWYHGEIY